MNTVDCWGNAETLGTDNHTYPSKNVGDKTTVKKCMDVRGDRPTRKPVLGNLEHEPGLQLIGLSLGRANRH